MQCWTTSCGVGALLLLANGACGSAPALAAKPTDGASTSEDEPFLEQEAPRPKNTAEAKLDMPAGAGDCTKQDGGCAGGDCAERCTRDAGENFERVCAGGKCRYQCVDATCRFDCPGGSCEFECLNSSCTLTCPGGGCKARCAGGGKCSVNCNGGGCDAQCEAPTECLGACLGGSCTGNVEGL